MSNQIKNQADTLWQTLSAPTTLSTYQQTLNLTWKILTEAALLLWLVLCLVLVFFDWFVNAAIALGRRSRVWFDNLQTSETDQLASDTGKALLEVGKTGLASTLSLARAQLGLPEKPMAASTAPAIAPAAVTSTPKSVAPPVVTSTPQPTTPDPTSVTSNAATSEEE
jgi:hypothetical protein